MNWRFWTKPKQSFAEAFDAWAKWEADMRERGFRHWLCQQPPHGAWIEVSRREWPMISVWNVSNVLPETNVANLWWREAKCDNEPGGIIEMIAVNVGDAKQYQIA